MRLLRLYVLINARKPIIATRWNSILSSMAELLTRARGPFQALKRQKLTSKVCSACMPEAAASSRTLLIVIRSQNTVGSA